MPGGDIVVAASKESVLLSDYPGSAVRLSLNGLGGANGDADSSAALIGRTPSLSSTNLGPGRNKLFVRGIADSSFNGPTPATVAQYFGEVRLNYAAPDPNLNLYDMNSVEVLEGPQGTLYGSASIGGIIRLIPNGPKLGEFEGAAEGGIQRSARGDTGGDAAAMANLPIGSDVAVRAVGYGVINPGYIDDIQRNRTDVNRTVSYGARLAVRYDPGAAISLEAGGVFQNLESKDGQYAELGLPPYTRRSAISQPFDNDFRLGYVTVRAPLWGAQLTSSTGFVRQELETQFDATSRFGVPAIFIEDLGLSLLSHETRLAGGDPHRLHWLLGLSGLVSTTTVRRQLGPVSAPIPLTGVRNMEREAALFGEITVPLLSRVSLTLGARGNYDEAKGRVLGVRVPEKSEPKRRNWRFLPKAALGWKPAPGWLVFAHYQEGFRPGGLSITGPTSAQKFKSDSVWTLEAGVRAGDADTDNLSGSVTYSRTRWKRIQADLIDATGLPFTSNIGNGRVDGIEAATTWRPIRALAIDAALFLNWAQLDQLSAGGSAELERNFPNIAETGGRAAVRYDRKLGSDLGLSAQASVRYVGRSFLGVSDPLNLPQGRYALGAAEARIGNDARGVRISVDNLFDTRANRFSYGNPFTVDQGLQITPLRPRTIRIGFDAHF
ncbi:TonB-dependent receptor [Sphingomonas tabacisoli]|uniref:TonB-dependent receptor n=1 Tax=Sphingomonas tabacisoli TaxID=2249466 RepID=A0ABW4I3U7_9SPHN